MTKDLLDQLLLLVLLLRLVQLPVLLPTSDVQFVLRFTRNSQLVTHLHSAPHVGTFDYTFEAVLGTVGYTFEGVLEAKCVVQKDVQLVGNSLYLARLQMAMNCRPVHGWCYRKLPRIECA